MSAYSLAESKQPKLGHRTESRRDKTKKGYGIGVTALSGASSSRAHNDNLEDSGFLLLETTRLLI
jgi:hypothetical protein